MCICAALDAQCEKCTPRGFHSWAGVGHTDTNAILSWVRLDVESTSSFEYRNTFVEYDAMSRYVPIHSVERIRG